MKRILTLFALLGLFSFAAQAQKGKVSGTVIDGSQKTIESATISLLRAKDSGVVKFSVASKEGNYIFDGIAPGKYLVSITAVGHQKGFHRLLRYRLPTKLYNSKPLSWCRWQNPCPV